MGKRNDAQHDKFGNIVYKTGQKDITTKKPLNKAESAFFDAAAAAGWEVTKRGWPDFFCVRGDEVCAVEVKPSKSSSLKDNQLAIMGYLSAAGIRCYKWTPDGGFEEVMGTVKRI